MERKRHLGNDIVVIIYIDSNDDEYPLGAALSFDPSCIKSKFNRIQLLQYIISKLPYFTYRMDSVCTHSDCIPIV